MLSASSCNFTGSGDTLRTFSGDSASWLRGTISTGVFASACSTAALCAELLGFFAALRVIDTALDSVTDIVKYLKC